MNDPFFRVEVLSKTANPQQVVYAAMHQDYSEDFVFDGLDSMPGEARAGELCVKRLLAGGRGHYGCYSDDTEVLTSSGWKAWPLVAESDKLAAVDIDKGLIKFEYPSSLQREKFQPGDKLYTVQSQKLDIAVTLDHRMVVSTRKTGGKWSNWQIQLAEQVAGKAVRYMLSGNLTDRSIPDDCPSGVDLTNLFKLAGFFFGDGCRSKNRNPVSLRFRLKLARKINYLRQSGFAVEVRKGDRYTINNKEVSAWINKHFSSKDGKVIPTFIMHLPESLFNAFADGLKNSDGCVKGSTWCYDSKEKESLDVLQAAFHLNGQSATLCLNNPNIGEGHENHSPCWRLRISSIDPFARAEFSQAGRTKGSEQLKNYDGHVYCATVSTGALLVRRNNKPVVLGNCLEHSGIVFNCGWFPHSVMQQARTHRVGVSFDVQSMRYTGSRILDAASGTRTLEEVFFLRPLGHYADRKGKKYEYTPEQRAIDLRLCKAGAERYRDLIGAGFAEEHARGILPFEYRQHFVASFNLRSVLHFMDLRSKLDAQEEIRALCDHMWPHVKAWAPEIATWYEVNRMGKARLAP